LKGSRISKQQQQPAPQALPASCWISFQ